MNKVAPPPRKLYRCERAFLAKRTEEAECLLDFAEDIAEVYPASASAMVHRAAKVMDRVMHQLGYRPE